MDRHQHPFRQRVVLSCFHHQPKIKIHGGNASQNSVGRLPARVCGVERVHTQHEQRPESKEHKEQNTNSKTQRTKHKEQNTKNREQRAEHSEQNTKNRTQRTENRTQRTEHKEQNNTKNRNTKNREQNTESEHPQAATHPSLTLTYRAM